MPKPTYRGVYDAAGKQSLLEIDRLLLKFSFSADALKETIESACYYLENLPQSLQPAARNHSQALRVRCATAIASAGELKEKIDKRPKKMSKEEATEAAWSRPDGDAQNE